jgi:hypothetical protein
LKRSSRGCTISEIRSTISAVFSLIHQKSVARASASAVIHAITNPIGESNNEIHDVTLDTIHGKELKTKTNQVNAVVTSNIFDASSGFCSIQSAILLIIGCTTSSNL